jgi:carbon-monoxide dehydrogenase iron sulfur subunit
MQRIVLNLEKCTGCRVCEAICSLNKEGEFNPVKSRIRVVRTVERSILHNVPVYCLQCEEPHCMAVCPVGAISTSDEGIKTVDEVKCIGCKLCEIACPVGAITVNQEKAVAIKCNLCTEVGEPQCVKYCYREALQLIDSEKVPAFLARAKTDKFLALERKGA